MTDLLSALCLVAVLEGLFLFATPGGWKRAAEKLHAMPDRLLALEFPVGETMRAQLSPHLRFRVGGCVAHLFCE